MCNHTDSIDLQKYKNVYFIGIGGSSMSSLAMILKRRGCVVRGYDRAHTRETEMLQNSGIPVYDTTDASHFDGAELIVYTVAFAPDHPEMVLAAQRGVPGHPARPAARSDCGGLPEFHRYRGYAWQIDHLGDDGADFPVRGAR